MIYKKQDIDRAFTETVTGLIAQGYQINPATMGGSQGEIAHIDLCKGNEILRVRLEQEHASYREPDYLSLTVGRYTEPLRNDKLNGHETLWNNRLEILSEIKYACAAHTFYDTPVYLDPVSGQEAHDKRERRWAAKHQPARRTLPEAFKSPALRWLRKQKGFKTCRLDEIESVTRVSKQDWNQVLPDLYGYEIKARGKTFTLRAPKQPA